MNRYNKQNMKSISYKNLQYKVKALAGQLINLKIAQEKSEYYGEILDKISDAVFYTDLEFSIKNINNSAGQMFGFPPDELLNKRFHKIVCNKCTENYCKFVLATLSKGFNWSGEMKFKTAGGSCFYGRCIISLLKDNLGSPIGLYIIINKSEINLPDEQPETFYQRIIDNCPAAIILVDTGTEKIIYANKGAEEITGYSTNQLSGMLCSQFDSSTQKSRFEYNFKQCIKLGTRSDIEMEMRKKNGNTIPVSFNTRTFVMGEKVYLLGIMQDNTKTKVMEEQLTIRQSMDSLGNLAGGIAHDFNNILHGIFGYLEMLETESDNLSESQKGYMKSMEQGCNRAAELIKQIQSLTDTSKSVKSAVDLHSVVEEVFTLIARTSNKLLSLDLQIPEDIYNVKGNESELNQVFLNLATNALHALHEKGISSGDYIKAEADKVYLWKDNQYALSEGKYIHITFSDSGTGIPPQNVKKIFEPLFSTKKKNKKGQGLGLAMVYNIITSHHGGTINVKSRKNEGTEFQIFLPEA